MARMVWDCRAVCQAHTHQQDGSCLLDLDTECVVWSWCGTPHLMVMWSKTHSDNETGRNGCEIQKRENLGESGSLSEAVHQDFSLKTPSLVCPGTSPDTSIPRQHANGGLDGWARIFMFLVVGRWWATASTGGSALFWPAETSPEKNTSKLLYI